MDYIFKEHLASFSTDFCIESLPKSVTNRAKLLFLDCFSTVISGNHTPLADMVIKNLASWSSKDDPNSLSPLLGTSYRNHTLLSTVINGISMVCQELDEGNPKAKGHPACHFFPALLGAAEKSNYSGKQLLEAFIVGYEINARVGAAIKLRKEIHPHGSWGLIGGGYALGKLNNFTKDEYTAMLALTSSLPFISLWNPILEGKHSRDLMIGLNNMNLLILPSMVKSGITSSLNNMESIYTSILGESINETVLSERIGENFYLMSSYFKFYPFCRFCHSPMEGVKELIDENGIQIELIKEVSIRTYAAAAMLNDPNPVNDYAGKFSIPYAISTFLKQEYGKTVDPGYIQVLEEESLTKMLPNVRASDIEIQLENGQKLHSHWHHAPGDAEDKDLEYRVIRKNTKILSNELGKEKSERIVERILELEHVESFKNIISLI